MSRSKRKPYVTDRYGKRIRKFYKRKHNKLIRKKCADPGFEIPDGAGHRRGLGVNPWDICDYKIYIHPEDDYYVKAVNK